MGNPDLWIGDLAQPRGGPMSNMHASHQSGIDADIWLDLTPKPAMSRAAREDVDVASKDRAAILWCENATVLTATEWQYIKVPQTGYESLQPDEFADLAVFVPARLI